MAELLLNPGAQADFYANTARHSAYMGGRGAGKTFVSIVRGLQFAQQPKVPGQLPPVGCILTDSFPHLKDIVYPAIYLIFEMLGWKENKEWREVKNQADRKFILKNGAEIKMRSLDEPNRVRGLNLSWFGIDEGRMFDSDEAYKILLACLRQGSHPDPEVDEQGLWIPGENYRHAGWVTSTPNGFDWQWRRFHPDSPKRKPSTEWYNAPTHQNARHLPAAFIRDLETDYEGMYYRQEVLGEFVGAVHGAVWPAFDPKHHVQEVYYDPNLPLYAGWDFGIGDASVILYAQVHYDWKTLYDGTRVEVPQLRILDAVEQSGLTIKELAHKHWEWLDKNVGGRPPTAMWGDPAGLQRQQVTGTSSIAALAEEGVWVRPCRRAPIDEGIIIVQNLMERPDGFMIATEAGDVQKAVQTYRFKVDDEGNKLSKEPIHDWTSHTCSALRYLALGAIGLHSRRSGAVVKEPPQRGTMGYILGQLGDQAKDEVSMGDGEPKILDWHPDVAVGLEGLV